MKRQLQIKDDRAVGEWRGTGAFPVPPDDSWVFIDVTTRPGALVGFSYDPATDTFAAPAAPPNYGRAVSVRDFLQLFTAAERKAIRVAAGTDDDVADWYALATAGSERIRLRHPTTIAGLQFLVAKGLLTAARRDAITA